MEVSTDMKVKVTEYLFLLEKPINLVRVGILSGKLVPVQYGWTMISIGAKGVVI